MEDYCLSYNDVTLVPKLGVVSSRRDVDTSTEICGIRLSTPIISSNMDTVTEAKMAIAMAKAGGLGVLHRYCSIEENVAMVREVKSHMSFVVKNPITVCWRDKIKVVKEKLSRKGSAIVVDEESRFSGIVTKRDLRIVGLDSDCEIRDVMTPHTNCVCWRSPSKNSKKKITSEEARDMMQKRRVEKLPLLNFDWTIRGLITWKDLEYFEKYSHQGTHDEEGRLRVAGSVGVNGDYLERAQALYDAGIDMMFVDVAHGHSLVCGEAVKKLKSRFPLIPIVAGNVSTPDGVKFLAECGASAVKVNIGAGSICITRVMTGCGVPQFTALQECLENSPVPIISDGGSRGEVGNIGKALALGAHCVMLGGFLSGTDETPGSVLVREGRKVKIIRGMAGYGANMGKRRRIADNDDVSDIVPEGVEGTVPYKGSVNDVLKQVLGGIRSTISYCGVSSLKDLPGNAEFRRVTRSSYEEGKSHTIDKF